MRKKFSKLCAWWVLPGTSSGWGDWWRRRVQRLPFLNVT